MESEDDLHLTMSQKKALEELERRISGELDEVFESFDCNYLLYRFLKARDWDVNKAESMLRKCLQWRKQNDKLIRDYKPSEFLRKYLANIHIGYDKEACPVFYMPSGKYDMKGIHMAAKYADIEKAVLQIFAAHENSLERESKKSSRKPTKFVVIFNEEGQTFGNLVDRQGIQTMVRLGKVQQDNFPERLKAIFFINAPSYFTFLYNVAKSILSKETMEKIHVFGTEGWQDELLKVIDAEQLPAFLGGTRTDPDGNPLCKTFLNQGGKVDEKYFIHKSRNPLSNSPGVKRIEVARSSSFRVHLDLKEAGSVIEWDFEIGNGDIGFALSCKDTDGLMTEEVPLQRLGTKDFSESGMYKCEKAGEYIVLFDNSHSWLRSKELFYRIKVLMPHELEYQIEE